MRQPGVKPREADAPTTGSPEGALFREQGEIEAIAEEAEAKDLTL